LDPSFNAFLLKISNQLSEEQLNNMKFLCRDTIGKRDMEQIKTGIGLFQILTERRKLGTDDMGLLRELLTQIQRYDLVDKVKYFETFQMSTVNQPDTKENAKLDIATDVIADNLGRNWRKLGRKLGLTDVKLESISKRHPTELDRTVIELLREWRKNRGAEARIEDLIKALRDCEFNLTADKSYFRPQSHGDLGKRCLATSKTPWRSMSGRTV
uniref:Uncharacterized protein n=1 Tax=Mola mola TaxID=94237 RepID=A0A3Q4BJM5_MOLML